MVDSSRSRIALAATAALATTAFSACGYVGSPDSDDAPTCGDRDWCHFIAGEGYTEGAYDPLISTLYCQVTEVRQRVATGQLDVGDLPAWAETDERDGAPIVIDIATVPSSDYNRLADEMLIHFRDLGDPLDREAIRSCSDALTQRDIEATDGKRQAG